MLFSRFVVVLGLSQVDVTKTSSTFHHWCLVDCYHYFHCDSYLRLVEAVVPLDFQPVRRNSSAVGLWVWRGDSASSRSFGRKETASTASVLWEE